MNDEQLLPFREISYRDFGEATSGRSVYLQGQLHANESLGLLVLHRLNAMLEESPQRARVRVVPNANPFGWVRYIETGEGRTSRDGSNWNRIFERPGGSGETSEKRLAAHLWSLSHHFDVIIDVHTPEFGWPHVYASTPELRLNTFDDLPHVFYGDPTTGPFDECHLRLRSGEGMPWASVTLELPSHSIPSQEAVDYWAGRLVQEVAAHAMGADHAAFSGIGGQMKDLIAPVSGVPKMLCIPGAEVPAGTPLLSVTNRSGIEHVISAPSRCVPVCFRRQTVVVCGYWAVRVISLEKE